MKRSRLLLYISATVLSGMAIVVIAWALAAKPNDKPNGFDRRFFALNLKMIGKRHLDSVYEKAAGTSEEYIYFKDYNPSRSIRTDKYLKSDTVLNLGFGHFANLWPVFFCQQTDSNIYILGANVPCIINHNLKNGNNEQFKAPNVFTKGIVLSPATAI